MLKKLFILLNFFLLANYAFAFDLCNNNATEETSALANRLYDYGQDNDSIAFGQHRIFSTNQSSFRDTETYKVCSKMPIVTNVDYSYKIGGTTNWDPDALKYHYEFGGIVTISWHMQNVVTGGDAWDTSGNVVANILTEGSYRDSYFALIDDFASWAQSFVDSNGNLIPIVFRPFHENDGNWFWWGNSYCTDEQFIQLWQETFTYLTETKGVNNLIWAYSPEFINNDAEDRYAGNVYVDICGIDQYTSEVDAFSDVVSYYEEAYDFSVLNGKLFAITEGVKKLDLTPDAYFWTDFFTSLIGNNKTNKVSYVSFWGYESTGVNSERSDRYDFINATNSGLIEMINYETGVTFDGVKCDGVLLPDSD